MHNLILDFEYRIIQYTRPFIKFHMTKAECVLFTRINVCELVCTRPPDQIRNYADLKFGTHTTRDYIQMKKDLEDKGK